MNQTWAPASASLAICGPEAAQTSIGRPAMVRISSFIIAPQAKRAAGPKPAALFSFYTGSGEADQASSPSMAKTGPESLPLASTSRSTNSITAIAALSP